MEPQSREAKVLLFLDSGATGAILSSEWVKNAQVPWVRRKEPTPILDAGGNHIPGSGLHYTPIVVMYIGDHMNKMRFEVTDMQARKVNGYLPIAETHILLTELSVSELVRHFQQDNS